MLKIRKLNCSYCVNEFEVTAEQMKSRKRLLKNGGSTFCSNDCRLLHRGFDPTKPREIACIQCSKIVIKKIGDIKRSENQFCSRSCAATYNNFKFPKRKLSKKCSNDNCSCLVRNYKSTLCQTHWDEYKLTQKENLMQSTIGDYRARIMNSSKNYNMGSLHAGIRGLAGSWFKHLKKIPCHNCGYSKHVELCHIKPVASFPDNATVGEINHPNNIIQLCPNCHWEFDRLGLKLENIQI